MEAQEIKNIIYEELQIPQEMKLGNMSVSLANLEKIVDKISNRLEKLVSLGDSQPVQTARGWVLEVDNENEQYKILTKEKVLPVDGKPNQEQQWIASVYCINDAAEIIVNHNEKIRDKEMENLKEASVIITTFVKMNEEGKQLTEVLPAIQRMIDSYKEELCPIGTVEPIHKQEDNNNHEIIGFVRGFINKYKHANIGQQNIFYYLDKLVNRENINQFDFKAMDGKLTEVLKNETKENVLKWFESKYKFRNKILTSETHFDSIQLGVIFGAFEENTIGLKNLLKAYEYGFKVLEEYIEREDNESIKWRDEYKNEESYKHHKLKATHLREALGAIKENAKFMLEHPEIVISQE